MQLFRCNRFRFLLNLALIAAIFTFLPSPAQASTSNHRHNHSSSPAYGGADPCSFSASRTGYWFSSEPATDAPVSLGDFVNWVELSNAGTVQAIDVCGRFALIVNQQPDDNPIYVSNTLGEVTQFRLAAQYGTIGLLAHNDLSGKLFFDLQPNDEVDVVFSDGSIRQSVISQIRHFQALEPENPYSSLLDLEHDNALLSSTRVFEQIYASGNSLVFQTCIAANGNQIWGRLFVIATPVTPKIKFPRRSSIDF